MRSASAATPRFAAKLVLFDLDGTLVHSAPDLADSINLMREELGLTVYPTEQITRWIGNGMARLVKRGLTGALDGEPDSELFERGLASFKRHYAANLAVRTRPYPGMVEVLDHLSAQGFLLGCVTNKMESFSRSLLEQLDLMKYFDTLVGGDTVATRKPDPLPLQHACAQCGVLPAHAVLIGDSAADVNGARAAGMPIIAVTYGYNQGRDVRSLNPDATVDSATELPQYLALYTSE